MHRLKLTVILRVLLVTLFAINSTSARSMEKDLTGYDKYTFGKTEEEVKSMTDIDDKVLEVKGTRILNQKSKVNINGEEYVLSFSFVQNRLRSISLITDTSNASHINCKLTFNRLYGLIKAKYGNSDLEPQEEIVASGIDTLQAWALFTAPKGSYIQVRSLYSQGGKECSASVAYGSRLDGNPF